MERDEAKAESSTTTPASQSPDIAFQQSAVYEAVSKLIDADSLFVTCAAGIERCKLKGKYDAAFVINKAYSQIREAFEAGEKIENLSIQLRLECTKIIQQLSKQEKEKHSLNRRLPLKTASVLQPIDWLDDDEATPEQLHMRVAFLRLSQLEQDILQLQVVKGLRWEEIQQALIAAGYSFMTKDRLRQKKRWALKHLEESYRAIAK